MRRTLQRSCTACAKSKHRCDLQTPKCSRCTERRSKCVYINQPLPTTTARPIASPGRLEMFMISSSTSVDPFDTYPATDLPRTRVQKLIFHFLSKITFQYYPWDLNPSSNPFFVSWWPLALADPALFYVSLQTACLDDEFHAKKGFPHSELLMRDAVSLIGRKIEDPELAFQDATTDAVVTMAAIEHGKGNYEVANMHVDAVKRMVRVRGGLAKVRSSSLLTSRMVPWVSMLVRQSPQFDRDEDFENVHGINPLPTQHLSTEMMSLVMLSDLIDMDLDMELKEVIINIRIVFRHSQLSTTPLSTVELQDLVGFVLHSILRLPHSDHAATLTECVRAALAIYMILLHGSTYYSHTAMLATIVLQLQRQLDGFLPTSAIPDALHIWLCSMGLVGSMGMDTHNWFAEKCLAASAVIIGIKWSAVIALLEEVVWLPDTMCDTMFHQAWLSILESNSGISSLEVSSTLTAR
ncbi:hypothetical protein BJ878DRAFT_250331 [Calycina marina]|uniref:Zn(2)-C6 fungal-type domain-containing protein n=1 Tax=Calycina marina TaxID=1763456 RepID=A0A9P7Z7M4_9HELO|nr:hypothetical protein BJ878DRAFT_250331 [Calycina marina]